MNRKYLAISRTTGIIAIVLAIAIASVGVALYYATLPPAEKVVTQTLTTTLPGTTKAYTTTEIYRGKTLTVSVMKEATYDYIMEYKSEFEEAYGVTILVDGLPWGGLIEKQLISLKADEGIYDVVHTCCDTAQPIYYSAGLVEPLNSYVERDNYDLSDYLPVALDYLARWPEGARRRMKPGGDILYGIPTLATGAILAIRTDLLAEAGYEPRNDWTWEDFVEIAKDLTKDANGDGEIDVWGTAFVACPGYDGTERWYLVYSSFGGQEAMMTDENLNPMIDNDYTRESLKLIRDLWEKYGAAPKWITTLSPGMDVELYKSGEVASVWCWANTGASLLMPKYNKYANVTAIVVPPRGPTGVPSTAFAGWSFSIAKNSRNKDLAWEFVKWVTSREMQLRMAAGVPPSRTSVYEDPEAQKVAPYFPQMQVAFKGAVCWPMAPEMAEIWDAVGKEFSAYIGGEIELEEAISRAVEAIKTIAAR